MPASYFKCAEEVHVLKYVLLYLIVFPDILTCLLTRCHVYEEWSEVTHLQILNEKSNQTKTPSEHSKDGGFPISPVAQIPRSQCRGPRFDPRLGN